MSRTLVYRQNRLFKIDVTQLAPKAKRPEVINALYAALYDEFKGAVDNDKYSNLTYKERMDLINDYAHSWLTKRGLK